MSRTHCLLTMLAPIVSQSFAHRKNLATSAFNFKRIFKFGPSSNTFSPQLQFRFLNSFNIMSTIVFGVVTHFGDTLL